MTVTCPACLAQWDGLDEAVSVAEVELLALGLYESQQRMFGPGVDEPRKSWSEARLSTRQTFRAMAMKLIDEHLENREPA
ncbi:hypothetical protein D869_gp027 [Caulobacter phage CcrRogue]|uniref:Uncharacterized protein n=1 Tax=Caulobacter phage CcrRogue TaxID=2927986 RepID=K4JMU4_9CAUD|nr:hypothetical protein D869_gp027 [Caulobacter phage CcrRogue]AFU86509.1 hypothetical protein CcrRogue_gp027 [Caulobacter phage CcrRogue]